MVLKSSAKFQVDCTYIKRKFDTSNWTFKKPRMSALQKCMVEIATRVVPIFGLANELQCFTFNTAVFFWYLLRWCKRSQRVMLPVVSGSSSLQDVLLYVTWTSQLRTGHPSIFAIQVWRTAYCITCITKLINTAARLVRAHLDFCTSWGQTQWFLLF